MDEYTSRRIKSLENSIFALRQTNKSDTLRENIKNKNRDYIQMYMNEIYNDILDEFDKQNKSLDYSFIKVLEQEIIF